MKPKSTPKQKPLTDAELIKKYETGKEVNMEKAVKKMIKKPAQGATKRKA